MIRSGRFEWPIVIAIVAVAAISRSPALIVLAAGGLVVWLVVSLTGRLALVGLETQLAVSPDRLIAGEPLVATVTVINRKPLPLPWLDLRLFLPEGIETPEPTPGIARGWVNAGFAPRGHERLVLRFPLVAMQRGAYAIGPVRLRGGDWLGFTVTERTDKALVQVVAYPAPLAVRDRQLPSLPSSRSAKL